jgi:hypothetical protein
VELTLEKRSVKIAEPVKPFQKVTIANAVETFQKPTWSQVTFVVI